LSKTPRDSLNRLELKEGIRDVQELKDAWIEVAEIFPDLPRNHLHIVAERPDTGEFGQLLVPIPSQFPFQIPNALCVSLPRISPTSIIFPCHR